MLAAVESHPAIHAPFPTTLLTHKVVELCKNAKAEKMSRNNPLLRSHME